MAGNPPAPKRDTTINEQIPNTDLAAALPAIGGHTTALSVQDILAQMGTVQEIMKSVLREGIHYGNIPGTKGLTLLQAGAEILMMAFHLRAEYEIVREKHEILDGKIFISFVIKCRLFHRPSGLFVAESYGACNSRERKYLTRAVSFNKATDQEKEIGIIEDRNGDYGPYQVVVLDVDPYEIEHTLLIIAKKRSKVGTVREALSASDALELNESQSNHLREVAKNHGGAGGNDGPPAGDADAKLARTLNEAADVCREWCRATADEDGTSFRAKVVAIGGKDAIPENLSLEQLEELISEMKKDMEEIAKVA